MPDTTAQLEAEIAKRRKEAGLDELEQLLAQRRAIDRRIEAALGASGVPPKTRRTISRGTGPTQNDCIVKIVREAGKISRDDIFIKLDAVDKQPRDLNQLSSLLSRLRKSGSLDYDAEDKLWFAK